jgi:hypothetical protein
LVVHLSITRVRMVPTTVEPWLVGWHVPMVGRINEPCDHANAS